MKKTNILKSINNLQNALNILDAEEIENALYNISFNSDYLKIATSEIDQHLINALSDLSPYWVDYCLTELVNALNR